MSFGPVVEERNCERLFSRFAVGIKLISLVTSFSLSKLFVIIESGYEACCLFKKPFVVTVYFPTCSTQLTDFRSIPVARILCNELMKRSHLDLLSICDEKLPFNRPLPN